MDLGDIEDLISSPNEYAENERLQFDHVIARVKKTNLPNGKKLVNKKEYRENLIKNKNAKLTADQQTNGDQLEEEEDDGEILGVNNINSNSVSYSPGQATIFVKTWGCTHNDSDAQIMAGLLQQYGYTITNNENDADLWLLNSCTVKSPAEQHFRNHIENGLKKGKKIVVSGCVSQAAPNSGYLKDISIVGVQQIDRVVEVVEDTLLGRTVRLLGVKVKENGSNNMKKKLINLNLPKIRKNDLIEIIAINVGCLNQCTYCKTKHARGELASYTMKEITDRARQSIKEGVKEIWITSEDTGAYGKDLEPDENGVQQNLPNLLRSVLNVIPNNCRLRVGMTNPPYIIEHVNEIVKIMNEDERIYKFLHIPVQSGSNIVLEDMKREYTIEEFQNIVDIMKEKVKGITIATDLILGFPTEAVEDFEDTVKLVERNKFPSLFINQFYPRPGTPAAKMQLIPAHEVKKRTKKVSEIFNNYFPYKDRIGKHYKILVTEVSSDRNFYVGHNEFYEQILIPKRKEYLGELVNVEIVSVGRFFMIGKLLNEPNNNLFNLSVNLFKTNKFKLTTFTCLAISLTILYIKFKKN